MGFRIFLVSAVAGLGFTLPTGKQVSEWHGSARAWVVEKFEDWDTQVLVDEDAYVVAAEPAPVEAEVPVIMAPSPVVTAARPVAAPTAPAPAPAPAVANTKTNPRIEVVTESALPTEPTDLVEADFDFAPAAAPASAPAVTPAPAVLISGAAFDAAQGEFVTGFVAEQVAAALAAAPAATLTLTDAAFDAAQQDFVNGFLAEETAAIAARKAAAAPAPAVDRAETAEDGENLYEGLAYALNRGAEGLEPAAAAVERAGEAKPSDRDGRLTNAVRLTRDAVYAWANLLHGPAVVTIGH